MSVGSSTLLPAVGLEIPCAGFAADVPLNLNGLGLVKLDLKGGIALRSEENLSGGLGGVKLRVIGLEFRADHPVLGTVILAQADVDTTPLSLLEIIKTNPPTYRQTLFLDFTVTIEKPPGGGPMQVLSNTKTARLINANLTRFPPQGAVYQLEQPVDLAPVGTPDQVVAQLQQFPVTFVHNP